MSSHAKKKRRGRSATSYKNNGGASLLRRDKRLAPTTDGLSPARGAVGGYAGGVQERGQATYNADSPQVPYLSIHTGRKTMTEKKDPSLDFLDEWMENPVTQEGMGVTLAGNLLQYTAARDIHWLEVARLYAASPEWEQTYADHYRLRSDKDHEALSRMVARYVVESFQWVTWLVEQGYLTRPSPTQHTIDSLLWLARAGRERAVPDVTPKQDEDDDRDDHSYGRY